MALLFVDGFDHLPGNYGMYGWSATKHNPYLVTDAGISSVATSATAGRRGAGCISPILGTQYWQTSIEHLATSNTVIVGYAMKLDQNPSTGSGYVILGRFLEYNAGVGVHHVEIRLEQNHTITINRGSTSTSLTNLHTTAAQTFIIDVWYYIEMKVTIDGTAGVVEIRKDGTEIANQTALDTDNAGTTQIIGQIRFAAGSGMNLPKIDDFYICDDTGTTNNDFLGDIRIDTLYPSGNGATNNFTPSAGSNYQNVDEKPPDNDTTYNSSDTVGHIDLYDVGDISHSPDTIYGVQVVHTVTRTDGVLREMQALVRSGTTNYDSGGVVALQDRYVCFCSVEEVDPNTSSAWTQTNINSMQIGVEVIT